MTEHITEQPWYDYQRCLDAVVRTFANGDLSLGSIFQVWITSPDKVSHPFYALRIQDTGECKERYRMCLYREPLIAQRMLRDLPIPEPKRKKLGSYLSGHIIYNPRL